MPSALFGARSARRPHLAKVGQSGLAGEVADLRQDVEDAFQAFDDSPSFGTYLRTVYAVPVFGNSGDPARVQAAIAAMAPLGGEVRLGAGTLLVPNGSMIVLPTGGRLHLTGAGSGKTIVQSEVDNSTVYNAGIYGSSVFGTPGTLAAPVTAGTKTFTSTTSLAVGDWCVLANAAGSVIVQIKAKSGSGTFTYTADRLILRGFSGGDVLTPITSVLKDVEIEGMSFTQATRTGLRAVNFIAAVRCAIRDVDYVGSGGAAVDQIGSFDTNCFDCEAVRVRARATLTGQGWSVESSERCRLIDCDLDYCNIGAYVIDSYNIDVVRVSAHCCTAAGLKIGGVLPGGGSRDVRVTGGEFSGSTGGTGVVLGLGSHYTLTGVNARYNNDAFNIGNHEAMTDVVLDKCTAANSSNFNYWVNAESSRVMLANNTSKSGAGIGTLLQGEATIDGLESVGDAIALYLGMTTGRPVIAQRLRISGATTGISQSSTIRATIKDSEVNAGTVIDHTTASILLLENVATTSSGGGTKGYQGIAGSECRVYGRVDLSTTATPWTVNATGKLYLVDQIGVGTPEGAVIASIGSTYLRNDGAAATTLYVKTSLNGNTGWTAK